MKRLPIMTEQEKFFQVKNSRREWRRRVCRSAWSWIKEITIALGIPLGIVGLAFLLFALLAVCMKNLARDVAREEIEKTPTPLPHVILNLNTNTGAYSIQVDSHR